MPTYEYVCTDCANQWEEMQKISEPPLEICPKCGKATAKRQISGGNFILKGGGWYADLYSSTPKKEGASSSSSSSSSSGSTAPAAPAKSESTAPSAAPATGGASSSGSGSPTSK